MWLEKIINKVKDFFNQYDTEEIIMTICFGAFIIVMFVLLIGLFVSLFTCI